jgi:transcriptional activator of cad operon
MSLRAGFTLGSWTIYPLEGRLVGESAESRIQPKSMDVLLCLADAENNVVEREALLAQVWGGRAQTDEPLTRCIGELRKALGDTRSEPQYIATIPKRGYRLLMPAIPIEIESKSEAPALTDLQKTRRATTVKRLLAGVGVLLAAAIVQVVVDRTFDGISHNEVTATSVRRANVSPKSVAVLAFKDLSQDQDQAWFADGLAAEVMNALSHTPDLLVLSRTSAAAYSNTDKDAATIARELGVANILQGSVRRIDDRLRVTAQLIRASDGFHVWSQIYDRDTSGVIAIQEDLALRIAKALNTTMDPVALANMVLVGTRSVEAYQDFIRGISRNVQVLSDLGNENVLEANEYFERARRIDPRFSAAHRQSANFWVYQLTPADTRRGLTDLTVQQRLDEYLVRINLAIESATNDIDRKVMMAQKAQVLLDLRDATQLYKEYLEERPNDLLAWQGLLRTAMFASDQDTALQVLDHYVSVGESDIRAAIYYMTHAYDWIDPSTAADFGLSAISRWPSNRALIYQTHRSLVWALRIDEAAVLAKLFGTQLDASPMILARQACAEGRRNDVVQMLADRRSTGIEKNVADWFMYRLLSDDENAVNYLRQFESEAVPFQLATWLHYRIVDASPFPVLMNILARENVTRPPPPKIPFACPLA